MGDAAAAIVAEQANISRPQAGTGIVSCTLGHGIRGGSLIDLGLQTDSLDGDGADAAIGALELIEGGVGRIGDMDGSVRGQVAIAMVQNRIAAAFYNSTAAAEAILDAGGQIGAVHRLLQELLTQAVLQLRDVEVDLVGLAVAICGVIEILIVGAVVVVGVAGGLEGIVSGTGAHHHAHQSDQGSAEGNELLHTASSLGSASASGASPTSSLNQ